MTGKYLRFAKIYLIGISIFLLVSVVSAQENSDMTDPYFGQSRPGLEPELFAPGLISLPESWDAAISYSPDMKELFFTRRATIEGNANRIINMKYVDGKWALPQKASFGTETMEYESFFTPDGERVLFSSERPKPDGVTTKGEIWYVEKSANGWSDPIYLDKNINDGWAMFVTCSNDNTLYFTGGYAGKYGVFKSELVDGGYAKPEYLPEEINSNGGAHPFIAPDESYLLFDAQPTGRGKTDLYVSFNIEGNWQKAIKFPEAINSTKTEGIASVSSDGEFIFFHRQNDIYWVSARILEQLK